MSKVSMTTAMIIESLQQLLVQAGFNLEEASPHSLYSTVWIVRIQDRDSPHLFSEGIGKSEEMALADALLGFCENVINHSFWRHCYLGKDLTQQETLHHPDEKWFATQANGSFPDGVLNEALQNLYNPDGELNASQLIDVNSSNRDRGIGCIPFQRFQAAQDTTENSIYFPVNILDNIYANNGSAIATSKEKSREKALTSIIARYVEFHVIANGLSLPEIPSPYLQRYSELQEIITEINHSNLTLVIHDASLGGKYPVICATLFDENAQNCTLHFSAHPDFEQALNIAIYGVLLKHQSEDYDGTVELGFDLDEISSPYNLEQHFYNNKGVISWRFLSDDADFDFAEWNTEDPAHNADTTFLHLKTLIEADGNELYLSETETLGMHLCQIIVPGFSEVFPQDKLVWENNNAGMDIRPLLLKQNKSSDECEQLILALEDLNHEDDYLIAELIAMPADENSIFNDLTIVELITLLAFKTQDNERIQEGCEWLCHQQQIASRRLKAYQCINTLLQLDGMTNYSFALKKCYSQEVVNDALALIDGEDVFSLESEWESYKSLVDRFSSFRKQEMIHK